MVDLGIRIYLLLLCPSDQRIRLMLLCLIDCHSDSNIRAQTSAHVTRFVPWKYQNPVPPLLELFVSTYLR